MHRRPSLGFRVQASSVGLAETGCLLRREPAFIFLIEAERRPVDFDRLIARAPAVQWQGRFGAGPTIPAEKAFLPLSASVCTMVRG
jgi:hypothetical protein